MLVLGLRMTKQVDGTSGCGEVTIASASPQIRAPIDADGEHCIRSISCCGLVAFIIVNCLELPSISRRCSPDRLLRMMVVTVLMMEWDGQLVSFKIYVVCGAIFFFASG